MIGRNFIEIFTILLHHLLNTVLNRENSLDDLDEVKIKMKNDEQRVENFLFLTNIPNSVYYKDIDDLPPHE